MNEHLDAAEADAKKRFDALKAEGTAIEANMLKEQTRLDEIKVELTKIQGEYRVIQNLRKAGTEGPALSEANGE